MVGEARDTQPEKTVKAQDKEQAGASAPEDSPAESFRCDFCGQEVPRVQRVALDRGYERLQTPHSVRYACDQCSEAKERRRLGREPA